MNFHYVLGTMPVNKNRKKVKQTKKVRLQFPRKERKKKKNSYWKLSPDELSEELYMLCQLISTYKKI